MSDNKKPAAKVRFFPISAAVWRNENEKGIFYSVTFERSYKDDSGKWQSSSTFNPSDLLLLAKVADVAHSQVCKLQANDRSEDESA